MTSDVREVRRERGEVVDKRQQEMLLGQLIRAHGGAVRVFVARYEFDWADAEEIVNDVYQVAFEHIDSVSGLAPRACRVWLFRVARYRAGNHGKRAATRRRAMQRLRREPPPFLASVEDEFADALDQAARAELDDLVARAFDSLSVDEKQVLQLHAQGLKHREIAERLGISPAAARKRLSRARESLRAAFRGLSQASLDVGAEE